MYFCSVTDVIFFLLRCLTHIDLVATGTGTETVTARHPGCTVDTSGRPSGLRMKADVIIFSSQIPARLVKIYRSCQGQPRILSWICLFQDVLDGLPAACQFIADSLARKGTFREFWRCCRCSDGRREFDSVWLVKLLVAVRISENIALVIVLMAPGCIVGNIQANDLMTDFFFGDQKFRHRCKKSISLFR